MILTQYYLECLSQASYLVGDERTGRAVVVDPRRDVGAYLADAAAHGLTIVGPEVPLRTGRTTSRAGPRRSARPARSDSARPAAHRP